MTDSTLHQQPFARFLQERLQKPLPGYAGQQMMAPLPAKTYLPPVQVEYRTSAVLALLCFRRSHAEPELVLTLRSSDLKNHSGQISFPGGRCEENESVETAALRETQEEIGLYPSNIRLLGSLSPIYVPVSTSLIHPIVGLYEGVPEPIPEKGEVDEVFFVQLSEFLNPERFQKGRWTMLGMEVDVPFWDVHPRVPLWGATAMMISELMALYEEFLP
jgi:8-oxo-dGTP pyrophosphatase MutT (NUDIX family)